jgi:hypothetical protein
VHEGQAVLVRERDGAGLVKCEEVFSGVLAEAGSMPSLRNLSLPSSYVERAVDAEAVCGLTLTAPHVYSEVDEDGEPVEEAGDWVLGLSRLTKTLTALSLEVCDAVTDKEVLALNPSQRRHAYRLCS